MTDLISKMDNLAVQEDELFVIRAIYGDDFEKIESEGKGGILVLCPNVPDSFKIVWMDSTEGEQREMKLLHLTPFIIVLRFPEAYPSEAPPDFALMCDWLHENAISKLTHALVEMWSHTKDVILHEWACFLKDALTFLQLESTLNISDMFGESYSDDVSLGPKSVTMISGILCTEKNQYKLDFPTRLSYEEFKEYLQNAMTARTETTPEHSVLRLQLARKAHSSLPAFMKEFDDKKEKAIFQMQSFECNVCFNYSIGRKCIRFSPCMHIFCKECVKNYLEVTIMDGRVENIHCLQLNCDSPMLPYYVKELVSPELFASYDNLLFTVSLSVMENMVYCPRATCQQPVLYDPDENMAVCTVCNYAFCQHCKMGFHGVDECRVDTSDQRELVRTYVNASEEEKKILEKRHGKRPLQMLVDNVLSEEWISSNSKACPQCHAHIEKKNGCNKMKCWRCMASFCWLCRKQIKSDNPYDHFLDGSTKCYKKLFE